MNRRGRPPHPGPLTRREHEILDLVRQGLTNAQIADSLDIARETVKWHVSEILSKLGVETREEAAAWRREEVSGEGWLKRLAGGALMLKLAGASVVAAALVGTTALGWAVLQTTGDSGGEEAVAEKTSPHEGSPAEVIARSTPTPRAHEIAVPTPESTPALPGLVESTGPHLTSSATPTPYFFPSPPFSPFFTPGPTHPATPTPTAGPPPSIRCSADWDCDGWSDALEVSYGSDPYIAISPYASSSTPEGLDFDATYSQSSCSDGYDNDVDGWIDDRDTGCGGTPPPTPVHSGAPTPSPRCGHEGNWDWDCDGWPDATELRYGSWAGDNGADPYYTASTPEDSDFDSTYGQSSCSDGIDNDGDGWIDGSDGGCGGTQTATSPSSPPFPLPT